MASSEQPRFDEGLWPVVVVTLPPVEMSESDFDAHCRNSSGYYERGQSFGFVFDVRRAPIPPAWQRRAIAELIDRMALAHPTIRVVVAFVVSSAIQRGVIKTINWLARKPVPTEVFPSPEPAILWAQKLLASYRGSPQHAGAPRQS